MDTQPIGLTEAELHFITRYKQPAKQIQALALMQIPFTVRPDGSVLVFRAVTQPDTGAKPAAPRPGTVNM